MKPGDIVMFRLNAGPSAGQQRPAIVVNENRDGSLNLQVFSDGTKSRDDALPNVFCVQRVRRGGENGNWTERQNEYELQRS